MSLQGVIKLDDKRPDSKCTLVYGQMNEPPGARARVALTGAIVAGFQVLPMLPDFQLSMLRAGLTVAEYFRDVEGQDVLLFVDNIFRFTQVCTVASH